MIYYVLVLSLEALDSAYDFIANRRLLAYAMALVPSNYSPGYSSARLALFPFIVALLQLPDHAMDGSRREEDWTPLQSLAVIYAYPRVAERYKQGRGKTLSPWIVKSTMEKCATRGLLHQLVEDLKPIKHFCLLNVFVLLPYCCSSFWIWLFVKRRHHSVLTRTPNHTLQLAVHLPNITCVY